jgi:tetratricopeptide (TPR) repeat protein
LPRLKSTHVDDPAAVGRRLKEARERAGLSQRQLSFPGCSPAYISRIEAGDRIPSLQLLREMGRRLGVSEDYLATGRERALVEEDELVAADVAMRLDDRATAAQLFGQALEQASSPDEQARALSGLGQLAFREGNPHEAIERLEAALALESRRAREDPALADTLGRAYAMVGELEAAIGVFEGSLSRAREREDFVENIRFSVLLSNALIDNGNFARAEELLGETLARVHDSRDPLVHARLYWSQSRLHAFQNDNRAAARYARKALDILELTEHTYYTARAYQLLAHIEIDRGNASHGLELARKGSDLLGDSGSSLELALFSLEQARALAKLGEREEAASLAMGISGRLAEADPQDAGRAYALLAEIYDEIGDGDRAIELYELAAELLEGAPNRYLVEAYARLADLLEAAGRKDDALRVLKKAVGLQAEAGRVLADIGKNPREQR